MNLKNITVYGILAYIMNWWAQIELKRAIRLLPENENKAISRGPFAGLKFPMECNIDNTTLAPMLLGCYEMELHNIINNLIDRNFTSIINVGAAEGYYAVGMAIKCSNAEIIAFEMNELMRQICKKTAEINGVQDRVTIEGECKVSSFDNLQLEKSLVIMDCEGAELDILEDRLVERLKHSVLLVELHDSLRPGCSRIIYQRFFKTHNIEFVEGQTWDTAKVNVPNKLSRRQRQILLDEKRLGIQEWVLLSPKT